MLKRQKADLIFQISEEGIFHQRGTEVAKVRKRDGYWLKAVEGS